VSDIVERLRNLAKAYPIDVFPEPAPGQHGKTVDQCSASMGRHFSGVFTEAAVRIEELVAFAHMLGIWAQDGFVSWSLVDKDSLYKIGEAYMKLFPARDIDKVFDEVLEADDE